MRVWLITGCSTGLGEGIAQAVLQQGDRAILTARKKERVLHFEKEYPQQAIATSMELSNVDSICKTIQLAYDRFGHIDVLVNNAGHGYRATIEESDPEQVHQLFEEDFFAPMEMIRMVLPHMRQQHSGLIINVTSIGAVRGALGNGYYSAAKGALELATEALQKEVKDFGIHTMLVEPGAMRTAFYGDNMMGTTTKIGAYDAIAAKYRKEQIVNHHDQLGDPKKCGKLLVQTALRTDAPFRLVLGSDALKAAQTTLDDRLQELHDWQDISIRSDY